MRITKYLSDCGLCARRKAEELVRDGKVRINGVVVKDPAQEVKPGADNVQVGSKSIRPAQKGVILFHKPRGVVSTLSDPEGRKSVADYITKQFASYFPIGRLDYDSSGLLVLTNDGDLANRLMHPRYGFDRVYEVRVRGAVTAKTIGRLQKGLKIDEDEFVRANSVRIDETEEGSTHLTISVGEGKNRMVRRMFDAVGHPVMKLKRIQHGPLFLGKLNGGEMRRLTESEYEALKRRVFAVPEGGVKRAAPAPKKTKRTTPKHLKRRSPRQRVRD